MTADVGVTERPDVGTCRPAASTFWTNAGAGVAPGVTPLDGVDSGPSPIALRARTRNVYVVPFWSPVIVAVVAGGDPDTIRVVWAFPLTYGVTS